MWTFNLPVMAFLVLNFHTLILNGQNYTEATLNVNDTETEYPLSIQKCCNDSQVFLKGGNSLKCINHTVKKTSVAYTIFKSNETHIDTTSKTAQISLYISISKNATPDNWYDIDKADILGIMTYNMSAILFNRQEGSKLLVPSPYYCVDYVLVDGELKETQFLFSSKAISDDTTTNNSKKAAIYFPCLTISAICFFIAACCNLGVLDVDEDRNLNICFIGFNFSMGSSFLILLVLHWVSKGCGFLGSAFLVFTIAGFVWFTFLYLHLMLNIRYFQEENRSNTLPIPYVIASLVIPIIVLCTSISVGSVDVPETFINGYNSDATLCNFENANIATFFGPIVCTIIISLICISVCLYYISYYSRTQAHNYIWLSKRIKYTSLSIYFLWFWIASSIWIAIAVLNTVLKENFANYLLDSVEAVLGMSALTIFWLNKHPRRHLIKKIKKLLNKQNEEIIEDQVAQGFLSETKTNGGEKVSRLCNTET